MIVGPFVLIPLELWHCETVTLAEQLLEYQDIFVIMTQTIQELWPAAGRR